MKYETLVKYLTIKNMHTVIIITPDVDIKLCGAHIRIDSAAEHLWIESNNADQWVDIAIDKVASVEAEGDGKYAITCIVLKDIVRQES